MLYAANSAGPGGFTWCRLRLLAAMNRFDGFAGLVAIVVSCWLNGSRLVLTLGPMSSVTPADITDRSSSCSSETRRKRLAPAAGLSDRPTASRSVQRLHSSFSHMADVALAKVCGK